jgi:hypothetical protein
MKIIECNNNKYIDEDLFKYINSIFLNYDIEINNNSNIFFAKNTTINRLITDYDNKGISRVIKREKADYVIINKFDVSNYPQYYDGNCITNNEIGTEVVYGFYNNNHEVQDTISMILDFIDRKQDVKYVNQNKLNESLNNGFIIDKDSYTTIKELVDSEHSDNHQLAVNMVIQSDLKSNWQWIVYLYHGNYQQLKDYDQKDIIYNYFSTLGLKNNIKEILRNIDIALGVVDDVDVKDRLISTVKQKFQESINDYFSNTLNTEKFKLNDFKIEYDANQSN